MIFSSSEFLFLFLPIVFCLYYLCIYLKLNTISKVSLLLSSLFYYAYWNTSYIYLIISSILLNYIFGIIIERAGDFYKKTLLILFISANVISLGYFKYTNFILSNINAFTSLNFTYPTILLPIGISFFTFQQIAYLSDKYSACQNISYQREKTSFNNFINYGLFISFFPQLVSGPIVHHVEMMPQFANEENKRIIWKNIYWGIVLLSIGLSKKVLIADNISPLVIASFETHPDLSFMEALVSSLAYSFQLYFDFSGYSDMAVGIGLLFNITLPFNFFSPYKARNIQEFWHRWHITLSRWLRQYVYIPLGGNRSGEIRTLVNLFITFCLGGIWHGASWAFIIWGVLHGICIILHRLWIKLKNIFVQIFGDIFQFTSQNAYIVLVNRMYNLVALLCTFLFVNCTWILFRASDLERVTVFLKGFLGIHGFWFRENYINSIKFQEFFAIFIAFFIVFFLKNTKELYDKNQPSFAKTLLSIILFLASIGWLYYLHIYFPNIATGEFIYFQF